MATAATKTEFTVAGENVSYALVGDELVIKIKVDHRNDTDAAKKTIRVASTLGNKEIPGTVGPEGTNVVVGVNAYVYRAAK